MFETFLVIFWISSKSYSKAELYLQEVSKGKRMYYQLGGVPRSFTIQSSFESLSVESNVMIDLGWMHHVATVVIEADLNDRAINVILKGHSPHGDLENVCDEDKKFKGSVVFGCNRPSRFVVLEINRVVLLKNVDVNGQAVHSEVFAGCYEYVGVRSSIPVTEIGSCISYCQQKDHYYAGYMDHRCFCFHDLFGMEPNDIEFCTFCGKDEDFCGFESNVLVYFAANFTYEALYPEDECVSYQRHCPECKGAEWVGMDCRIRNCSANDGACGEFSCMRSNDRYLDASFCSCNRGYNVLFMGTCVDIDECSETNNSCQQQLSDCENTVGSFVCHCSPGLIQVNEIKCTDIDECQDKTRCQNVATECVNTWASYYCKCKTGYERLNADGCQDVDECSKGLCKSGSCENTVGSFHCNCSEGFLFKNDNCEDIDECSSTASCDLNTTYCINNEGSFKCSCKSGHERLTEYLCLDIDECLTQTHACDTTGTCVNTIGSYLCNCQTGLSPISYTYIIVCEDIDECEDSTCDNRISFCVNHVGGYRCQCLSGLRNVDDFTCAIEKENVTQHKEVFDTVESELDLTRVTRYMVLGIFVMLGIIISNMAMSLKTSKRNEDVISDGTLSIESIL